METAALSTTSVLYKLWQRAQATGRASVPPEAGEWNEQVFLLSQYGRGVEEALKFLYSGKSSYEAFTVWLQEAVPQMLPKVAGGPMLTASDLAFWDANGYIVVKDAVPQEQCAAAREALWAFLGADPGDPESWYADHPGKNGMMLSFFQHPALQANRTSPRIKSVYQQLYGDTDIYLLMDKMSYNPPENKSYRFKGSPLHWDVSLHPPIPFELQGLLYLTDTAAGDGAFHCVPGFHREVETWLAGLPEGTDARELATRTLTPVPIAGNAGDLVIWHQALPHCATPNTGTTPRMVQYIAYKPVLAKDTAVWK